MTTTRIKVVDFEQAMFRYVREQVKKANVDRSTMLTAAEAKALPKDLRDNFEALGKPRVNASKLMKDVSVAAAYAARKADRNRDGYLSATEAKAMPAELRDNFQSYAAAMKPKVKDTTPTAVRRAHDAAFPSLVGYAEAFKKAEAAVLTSEDSPESPRALLKALAADDGRDLTDAQLKQELQKRFSGLELLPVGDVGETYVESATHWVFAVDLDVGTDHGFWACVDRQTGEVSVEGFN